MKNTGFIIVILALFSPLLSNAQDGEGLFKAKCNVCHLVDANSTGPILKGVKAKWDEAGEGDFLYEWVKDPNALVASGKSEMAKKADKMTGGSMTPQSVSNEEIDAIFSYVDNYVPKVAPPPPGEKPEVTYVPNYNQNLNLFYGLSCLALVLLFSIITMSGSITRFVKSDYFKNNAKDRGNNPYLSLLLLVGFTALMSNTSHALTFMDSGEAGEDMPWLLVENLDIYVLIFINIVLIAVLLYMRRTMRAFMFMTQKDPEIDADSDIITETAQKVNSLLTDVVPIEEEHTILLEHEYDGIKELDNNLPPWWVWMFYATIIFGVVYIFNYHILGTSDLQIEEYNKDVKQAELDKDAYLKANAMNVTAETAIVMTESSDLATGKKLYSKNCAACHQENGGGQIGPNLSDKNWIYGFEIGDVFTSIQKGRPNGMREHESILNPIQIQQISSYILSLPEVEGRPAEGDIIEK